MICQVVQFPGKLYPSQNKPRRVCAPQPSYALLSEGIRKADITTCFTQRIPGRQNAFRSKKNKDKQRRRSTDKQGEESHGIPSVEKAGEGGRKGLQLHGQSAKVPSAMATTGEGTAVVIAAGGTGGHVFPGIAVAQALMSQVSHPRGGTSQTPGSKHLGHTAQQSPEDMEPPDSKALSGVSNWDLNRERQNHPPNIIDSVVQFIGSADRMESKAVPSAGFTLHTIPTPQLPRRPRWRLLIGLLLLPFQLAASLIAALVLLLRLRPRVVLGTGGYVALPTCLAAALLRIPLIIQEQNAHPGLANRVLSLFASSICLGFPAARDHFPSMARKKCIVTGNPMRLDLIRVARMQEEGEEGEKEEGSIEEGRQKWQHKDRQEKGSCTIGEPSSSISSLKQEAMQYFFPSTATSSKAQTTSSSATQRASSRKLPPLVLLLMGGSLGAAPLNRAMAGAVGQLLREKSHLHVLWQTGKITEEFEGVLESHPDGIKGDARLAVTSFIERMDLAYAAADVAVCRAGAITCSELLVTRTPSILIPSPYVAEDHQTRNAEALASTGAALLMPEAQLNPKSLQEALTKFIVSSEVMDKMRTSCGKAATLNSAQLIADILILYTRIGPQRNCSDEHSSWHEKTA